ncbi:MAG: sulfotransferase domain-containing protein [bacterium]
MRENKPCSFLRKTTTCFRRIFRNRDAVAGNDLKIYPDDVFVVCYPRSGNTWIRFLLGTIIFGVDITFDTMESYVPDIYVNTHAQLERLARPRYLKSHEPYDRRYPKAIYLVRDPRDVAISYYYWMLKFNRISGTLQEFLDIFFDRSRLPYGRWDDHVRGWERAATNAKDRVLFMRYEDLLANTPIMVHTITAFLGLPADSKRINDAIRENDFTSMKQKETAASSENELFKQTRKDIRFVRAGKQGQWEETLSPEQQERFFHEFGKVMETYGYGRSRPGKTADTSRSEGTRALAACGQTECEACGPEGRRK